MQFIRFILIDFFWMCIFCVVCVVCEVRKPRFIPLWGIGGAIGSAYFDSIAHFSTPSPPKEYMNILKTRQRSQLYRYTWNQHQINKFFWKWTDCFLFFVCLFVCGMLCVCVKEKSWLNSEMIWKSIWYWFSEMLIRENVKMLEEQRRREAEAFRKL
jgi:hypothetical protein